MLCPSEGHGVRRSGYGISSHRHTGVLAFWLPQPHSAWKHPAPSTGAGQVRCPHSAWEHPAPSAGAGEVHCSYSAWERSAPSADAGLCVRGLRVCLISPLIWGSGPCDYSNPPPSSSVVPGGSAQSQPTINNYFVKYKNTVITIL